jgi:hypothetical protein
LVLGVLWRLEVATGVDRLIPPHPAHGLSCGCGVEALVLAILDGHHALYKVGKRPEERGMLALLQPGLTRAALNDHRLGHILDALSAANLNRVFSVVALKALEAYAIPTPGSIRIRRPLRSMERMKMTCSPQERLALPMGIAKTVATISNRSC